MLERFVHCGFYNQDNLYGRGGATIALVLDEDKNEAMIGLALCSIKDNYNRAIGRQIAIGRAKKNGIVLSITKDQWDNHWHELKKYVLSEISAFLGEHTAWFNHQRKMTAETLMLLPIRKLTNPSNEITPIVKIEAG